MRKKTLDSRSSAMDIIRVFAVFSVVAVHFFYNNGFYMEACVGIEMFIMCIMRTFFSVCIPMFLMLTGWLMCKKTLCRQYYFGIVKILLVYLLASIACYAYDISQSGVRFKFGDFIWGLLGFSAAPYSWYIEMYIGLFLIIPFLNLIYNGLNSKRKKQVLLLTLFAVTILPTMVNIFNFSGDGSWFQLEAGAVPTKILPEWWRGVYPITYYFFGCYLREYGLKAKGFVLVILLAVCVAVSGVFNYLRSYNTVFDNGAFVDWGGFEPFFMSVILFELFRRLKADKLPKPVRWTLWKISDAALGIYLVSYIFDRIFYKPLAELAKNIPDQLVYFLPTVLLVFACSLALSLAINLVVRLMYFAADVVKSVFTTVKSDEGDDQDTDDKEKDEDKHSKGASERELEVTR